MPTYDTREQITPMTEILPGIVAEHYKLDDHHFVRAQIDPTRTRTTLTWDEVWPLVEAQLLPEGLKAYYTRFDHRIHLFEDGTEIRQLFLGTKLVAEAETVTK